MSFLAISVKKEGHRSKPAKYKHIPDDEFADPVNFKYPIDKKHVQAAWNYINVDANRAKGGYTPEEWALIKKRVKAAMKKYGHEISENSSEKSALDPAVFQAFVDGYPHPSW